MASANQVSSSTSPIREGESVASAPKVAAKPDRGSRSRAKTSQPSVPKGVKTAPTVPGNSIRAERRLSRTSTPAPDTLRDSGATSNDSTAIPAHIQERFIRIGNRYYFPNGDKAFRDRGGRLTTQLENTEVIRSLLDIAQARGWQRVTVSGSERFRREAWQQARAAGLTVRGYRPSEVERAQLVRQMDRERQGDRERDPAPSPPNEREAPDAAAPSSTRRAAVAVEGRLVRGRLIDHGAAKYRFDRHAGMSYFVKVETPAGDRTVWGRDLERAVSASLSQAKKGDEVAVRLLGEKPVTVVRPTRDAHGAVIGRSEVAAYRNRWNVETREFLDQRANLARVIRDPSIDPKAAARERPELIGTYLELKAAELVAKEAYPDPRDQQRFVTRVREAIAAEIERGEPLSPVRVREPARRVDPQRVRTPDRQAARTLS